MPAGQQFHHTPEQRGTSVQQIEQRCIRHRVDRADLERTGLGGTAQVVEQAHLAAEEVTAALLPYLIPNCPWDPSPRWLVTPGLGYSQISWNIKTQSFNMVSHCLVLAEGCVF